MSVTWKRSTSVQGLVEPYSLCKSSVFGFYKPFFWWRRRDSNLRPRAGMLLASMTSTVVAIGHDDLMSFWLFSSLSFGADRQWPVFGVYKPKTEG
jgi:hypothetical protein